jgi:outer membrane receptor protein involved in Fe transport
VDKQPADIRHWNGYAYSYVKPVPELTLTLGVSADFANGNSDQFKDREQFNPKVGVTWNPLPDTTLRAALFRTLKRTLITDQTLEPTQVAGFNQFYDDFDSTETWRYGVAADQRFTKTLFGGVELSKRVLEVPFQDANDPTNIRLRIEQQDEYSARSYVYWAPHPWWAFRVEYAFEKLTTEGSTDQPKELNTHRLPLVVSFFHPSGFSAFLRGTYFNQYGRFVLNDTSIKDGSDSFAIFDAAVSYRLPYRYGFISAGVTNLLDKEFRYFDRDFKNPSIQPDRMFFTKITVALP